MNACDNNIERFSTIRAWADSKPTTLDCFIFHSSAEHQQIMRRYKACKVLEPNEQQYFLHLIVLGHIHIVRQVLGSDGMRGENDSPIHHSFRQVCFFLLFLPPLVIARHTDMLSYYIRSRGPTSAILQRMRNGRDVRSLRLTILRNISLRQRVLRRSSRALTGCVLARRYLLRRGVSRRLSLCARQRSGRAGAGGRRAGSARGRKLFNRRVAGTCEASVGSVSFTFCDPRHELLYISAIPGRSVYHSRQSHLLGPASVCGRGIPTSSL